jgi:hypothetical protein
VRRANIGARVGSREVTDLESVVSEAVAVVEKQELLVAEVFGANDLAGRERMILRDYEREFLGEQSFADKGVVFERQGQEEEFGFAPAQSSQQIWSLLLVNDQFVVGEVILQCGDDMGEEIGGHGGDGAQAQPSAERFAQMSRELLERTRFLENASRGGNEGFAVGSEDDSAGAPVEELASQSLLEFGHLVAEGRLADVTGLGRAPKMEVIGHGDGIFELA